MDYILYFRPQQQQQPSQNGKNWRRDQSLLNENNVYVLVAVIFFVLIWVQADSSRVVLDLLPSLCH